MDKRICLTGLSAQTGRKAAESLQQALYVPVPLAGAAALASVGEAAGYVVGLDALRADPALAAALGRARATRPVPLVCVLEDEGFGARLDALRSGADHVLLAHDIESLGALLAGEGGGEAAPYRILLVDDDRNLSEFHAAVLREAGMQARVLQDPLGVIEAIDGFAPDAILLNVHMPKCTGLELAAAVRLDSCHGHVAIVFLSADEAPGRKGDYVRWGGDDFLHKPVEPDHLVAVLSARVRHSRQLRRLSERRAAVVRENEFQRIALDRHAVISIADTEGNIVYVNDRFCELTGYARAEVLGRNHRLLKSGRHAADFYAEMWRTLRAGRIWQGHMCSRRKDGSLYWAETTVVPFLDENGTPYQFVAVRTDITELLRTQENLADAQRIASLGSWQWELATGEVWWSEEIYRILGLEAAAVRPGVEAAFNTVHVDDRELVRREMGRAFKGEPYDVEHRIVRPDGTIRWVRERGRSEPDESGRPARVRGTVQDVTERKEADQARERLLAIIDASPDFIGSADRDGNVFYVNAGGRRMQGLADDAQPKIVEAHPEWALTRLLCDAFPTAKRDGAWIGESALLAVDGREIPVRQVVIAHKGEHGEITQYSTVMQDLSQQKAVESALIRAKEQAESASRAKSEFLSRMSHELRTPMNAILGFGQLLESDPAEPLSASQGENVRQILSAGWHLLSLINEVLDLARIESGRIELSLQAVELGPLVGEALTMVGPQAKHAGVRMEDGLAAGMPLHVRADRGRLKQVLINLLSNAVKYNRAGGKVSLCGTATADGRVRIEVHDTGRGMTQEQLDHLFEPFTRFENEAGVEGTGIGLTITLHLVRMMGGRIEVSSRAGEGSTFAVVLPAAEAPEAFGEEAAGADDPADAVRCAGHTLLYVEDNPANLELVRKLMARRPGCRLLSAEAGRTGYELARREKPDLILLDINLPGLDGYAVKALLDGDAATRRIPVVALSAHAMESDRARSREAGFAAHLTKPIELDRLFATLQALLECIRRVDGKEEAAT